MAAKPARSPVLNDMSDDDTKAFEAMRDDAPAADPGKTEGKEGAPKAPPEAPDATALQPEVAPQKAAPEVPEGTPPANTVPHAALHEERERRKELAKELAVEREARQALERRFSLVADKINAPAPVAPAADPKALEIPDPEQDALGALKALREVGRNVLEQQQRQGQQQAAALQEQQLMGEAARQEAAYIAAEAPDYHQAAAHLVNGRVAELSAIGYNQSQIAQQIDMERRQLARMALQSGRNPAALVYALAQARGYAKAPAVATAPAAVPAAGPVHDAAAESARAETLRRGEEQSQSLSRAGGAAPRPQMTAERLATMPDAEFNAAIAKLSAPQLREIFGN